MVHNDKTIAKNNIIENCVSKCIEYKKIKQVMLTTKIIRKNMTLYQRYVTKYIGITIIQTRNLQFELLD